MWWLLKVAMAVHTPLLRERRWVDNLINILEPHKGLWPQLPLTICMLEGSTGGRRPVGNHVIHRSQQCIKLLGGRCLRQSLRLPKKAIEWHAC